MDNRNITNGRTTVKRKPVCKLNRYIDIVYLKNSENLMDVRLCKPEVIVCLDAYESKLLTLF